MKPSPWVFILFSLVMGIVIMTFPYIITLFNRSNKEKFLIWRKFLIILFVCYIPVIAILYTVYIATSGHFSLTTGPDILYPWWIGYYFGYIVLTIFVKKRTNLQLGWFKFIILATAGYLMTAILFVVLSGLLGDPLISLLSRGAVNYIASPQ